MGCGASAPSAEETLLDAAEQGNVRRLRAALDAGADVNAVPASGVSALQLAVFENHEECVQLLLERGASVNSQLKEHANATPLHVAAVNGRLSCLRLLLQHGADVELTKTDGQSALHRAAADDGHLDCVLVLLEHGANRHARDKAGRTPSDVTKSDAIRTVLRIAAAPAAGGTSASGPSSAELATLLSRAGLASYGPALDTMLGCGSLAATAFVTDEHLQLIGMKPVERCVFLDAAASARGAPAPPALASAPAPIAPAPVALAPAAAMERMHSGSTPCDVMISYRVTETGAGGDGAVFALQGALRARGFSVFVGEGAIQGGEEWPDIIQCGVQRCKAMVVLCSPTYGDTVWTKREFGMADNLRKLLIPVWHSGPYPPAAVAIYLGIKQRIPTGNFSCGYVESGVSHAAIADELADALLRAGVPCDASGRLKR